MYARHHLALALCVALSACAVRQAQAQEATYSVIDLGTLGSNRLTLAFGLNIFDQVVGASTTSAMNGTNPIVHAFLWTPEGSMQDLFPTAADKTLSSVANGIDSYGEVCGYRLVSGGGIHAFVGDPTIGLQTYSSDAYSIAYGLNDEGYSTGAITPTGLTSVSPGLFSLDGSYEQALPNVTVGQGYGINNDYEDVVGYFQDQSDFMAHALFIMNGTGTQTPLDIGSSPDGRYGPPSAAFAVDDGRNAVGYATDKNGLHTAVLFNPIYGGVTASLGFLPGSAWSEAHAINSFGQIVGQSGNRAFVWQGEIAGSSVYGAMSDLNRLIPRRSGWSLREALNINDAGDIVGYGVYRNRIRAFLLIPTVLQSMSIYPAAVTGGQSFGADIELSQPAPFDVHVSLTSNSTSVIVPHAAIIRQGETTVDFPIQTSTVTQPTYAVVRASFGGATMHQVLTVTP